MPRVLLVNHGMPPHEYTGTPIRTEGFATALVKMGWDVGVAYTRWEQPGRSTVRRLDVVGEFVRFEVPASDLLFSAWSLREDQAAVARDGELGWAMQSVLDDFAPDIVHVIDMVNLPAETHAVLVHSGVPLVRHVCNFEDVCSLLRPANQMDALDPRCPSPITPRQCAECFSRALAVPAPGPTQELLATLRVLMEAKHDASRSRFSDYDRVIFSTSSFRTFFEETLPLAHAHVAEIPAGIAGAVAPKDRPLRARPQGTLVFAVAATVSASKGAGVLAEALREPCLIDRDLRVELHGPAEVDPDVLFRNDPRVVHHGPYRPDELGQRLSGADIALAPSIFETFHRVTREYLCQGLPVIGTHAFGIPEIIQDGRNGLLVPTGDPVAMAHAMVQCLDSPDLVMHLARGARETAVRSVEEEVTELVQLYRELM